MPGPVWKRRIAEITGVRRGPMYDMSHLDNILMFDEKTAKKSKKAASGDDKREVVVFPGVDVRKIAQSLEFWKKTGKPYRGAPD